MLCDLRFEIYREYEIPYVRYEELRVLLEICFPGMFRERPYFKQLPHFRSLAYADGQLIGQVGIDHRVVRVGTSVVTIFGIIDLCVHPDFRNHTVGRQLLNQVCELGAAHGVQFAILMADDQRLYEFCGFCSTAPECRWLAVENLESIMVIERNLGDCFMVLSLSGEALPAGPVDFLGYLF